MVINCCNVVFKVKIGLFFDVFIVFGIGREFEFVLCFIDKLGGEVFCFKGVGDIVGLIERVGFCQLLLFMFEVMFVGEDFCFFMEEDGLCDD